MRKFIFILFLFPFVCQAQMNHGGIAAAANRSKVAVFYFDKVKRYPSGTTVFVSDSILGNTRSIGADLGTGNTGIGVNIAYSNNQNSIDSTTSVYPGHKSLHLVLKPFLPTPLYDSQLGSTGASNFRSEVYIEPWHYPYAVPSEIWLAWTVRFSTMARAIDLAIPGDGGIHQNQASQGHPNTEIWMYSSTNSSFFNDRILIRGYIGDANSPTEWYYTAGQVKIQAGKRIDFIEHVIWDATGTPGTPSTDYGVFPYVAGTGTGLYELWVIIDGVTSKVCTYTGPTAYSNTHETVAQYGGTPKFGIYHYAWHTADPTAANNSVAAGTDYLESWLGVIKFMYNLSGHYNSNGFNLVKP